MSQLIVYQIGNRHIQEKNDVEGHFMEFLMHDQMDHFKPFTWIQSTMKYQDEFFVQEGNGTFVLQLLQLDLNKA